MSKKTLYIIVGLALALVVGFVYGTRDGGAGIGSVTVGNEYNATTTSALDAGVLSSIKSTTNTRVCSLGSVIVASTTLSTIGNLNIMDATSTTDVASTTLASFDAGVPAGTYTFDVDCKRGISIDTPVGFDGFYTVTWR